MCEISGNGSLKNFFSRSRNFFWRWKSVEFVVGSLARPGFHPSGWGGAGALPRVSAAQRKIFFWGSIFLNENCILGVFFWPALGKKSCPFFRDSEQLWAVTRHIATFWDVFKRFQTFSNVLRRLFSDSKWVEAFWRVLRRVEWSVLKKFAKMLKRCWSDAEAMLKRCWSDVEKMLKRCWNDDVTTSTP